jgi:hypothetical protein
MRRVPGCKWEFFSSLRQLFLLHLSAFILVFSLFSLSKHFSTILIVGQYDRALVAFYLNRPIHF